MMGIAPSPLHDDVTPLLVSGSGPDPANFNNRAKTTLHASLSFVFLSVNTDVTRIRSKRPRFRQNRAKLPKEYKYIELFRNHNVSKHT